MKKRLALTALAAVAVGVMAAPSWAFQSVKIATVTAGTTVGGQRIADFTFAIRDTNNPFGANQSSITWSGATPSTVWKMADELIIINSTVTDAGGGIKFYTDNTHPLAVPRFVDVTPSSFTGTGTTPGVDRFQNGDSLASGLLNASAATTGAPGLPLAWSIKSTTRTVESGTESTGIGAADPNNGPAAGFNNRFQWLRQTDAYNWVYGVDLNNNNVLDPNDPTPQALNSPFVTMINAIGIHFGQNANEFGSHPDGADAFVYLEADFRTALAQTPYQTSVMRIEAYIQ